MGKLTDTKIKHLKSKEKDYRENDGNSLYIKINKSGSKSWQFRYKRSWIGLGSYPALSLKNARAIAIEYKELVANGENPKVHRELTKSKDESLFINVAMEAIRKLDIAENTRNKKLRWLDKDIRPVFGNRYIDTIKTLEISKFIKRFDKTPSAQRKRKDLLSNIYSYAKAMGFVEHNIVKDISSVLSREKGDNYAYINPIKQTAWLSQLLNDIDNYPGDIIVKKALQLLPYIAFRPGVVRMLEWSEINEKERCLVVPASKMKNTQEAKRKGNDFIQPLSTQAFDILMESKRYSTSNYVFSINDKELMSENTLNDGIQKTLGYSGKSNKPKQTSHGFRHIFTTGVEHLAAKYGWRELATESCLAHVSDNKVKNAYNGYDYMEERANIMQVWADYVDHIKENANVIRLADIG